MDTHVCNVPNIVASCVVLHNLCESYGDYCHQDWIVDVVTTRSTSGAPSSSSVTNGTTSPALQQPILGILSENPCSNCKLMEQPSSGYITGPLMSGYVKLMRELHTPLV